MKGLNAARSGVEGVLDALGSLADPTRLRLLALLERHELGVVELCEVLQLPQSTVSRHLKVLSEERWLASRRDGTARFYRMEGQIGAAARGMWKVVRAETEGWSTLEHDAQRLARRLASRREEAEAFFSQAAAEWEKLRAELYGTSFASEAVLALLPRGWTIADLGCGTGDLLVRLARHARRVVGVDRSAAMLQAARRRAEGLRNVELHQADLESLPIADASCDAASLALTLTYQPEPARVLAEAARIVRPGGAVAVVDLVRHDDDAFRRRMGQANFGFESRPLAALLGRAGFSSVRCNLLPQEPGARGPALLVARGERPTSP